MLNADDFKKIVNCTPLIALDFILKNSKEEYFLGKRINSPARGFYFVPGGRILKSESLESAVQRLTQGELGIPLAPSTFKLKGIYEHLYEDSFFGPQISTHYIVIALESIVVLDGVGLDVTQHSSVKKFTRNELMASDEVHPYTKNYFINHPSNALKLNEQQERGR